MEKIKLESLWNQMIYERFRYQVNIDKKKLEKILQKKINNNEYKNDCLIAGVEYNKSNYADGDLKPEENLFFKIKIIPFGELNTPSVKQ